MLTMDEYSELTQLRVRGLIARMHTSRRVRPTKEVWAMLRGEKEITARDLGEISYSLGFEVDFYLAAREPETDDV